MAPKNILPRKKIADFIDNLYDGDLHAKRVLSLANATLGVLVSASLAVHAIGQGLAQALDGQAEQARSQAGRPVAEQSGDRCVGILRLLGSVSGRRAPGSGGGDGLDELRARSARHGGVVDVDRSWTCDAADVEDGEVVAHAEGADEAL